MVKKIKKYLKFVVCCALILSLIAPSYAALSASDGSAFVTKAEFDSALADFNARLTTFEAGINSKIDSQVTSYLDRNGIWNGAAQTIDPLWMNGWNCEMQITDQDAALPETQTFFLPLYYPNRIEGDNRMIPELVKINYAEMEMPNSRQLVQTHIPVQTGEIIHTITKSGMIFMTYQVRLLIKTRQDNTDWDGWLTGIHSNTGAAQTGGWYTTWYRNYYQKWSATDPTKQCANINSIPMDVNNVYFRGLYILTTSDSTWDNWTIRPYWCYYTQSDTGEKIEKMRFAGDSYTFDNGKMQIASTSNYVWRTLPFGDYTFTSQAQFFVSKGDKLLVGAGAEVGGWQPELFYSFYKTAGIAMVIQTMPPSVY